MSLKSFWAILAGTTIVAMLASAWASTGPTTAAGKVWEVRYHKTHPNKNGDIAVRLKITATGTNLTAKLSRYDAVNPPGPGGKRTYKKRTDGAGDLNMTGTITKAGGGKARKRESFELSGSYTSTGGVMRDVTVKGFHHAGRDRKSDDDDWLCVRIHDKLHTLVKSALPAPTDPCDEQPPDEDNLGEEDAAVEPPEYDAENP